MSATDTLNTVVLGVGVVFAGLIAIIILCKITSAICMAAQKSEKPSDKKEAPSVTSPAVIENRQEIIAAVSAVIAEELGTDISAIRIHSFKKI